MTQKPNLNALAESISKWQARTFKGSQPGSAAEHLRREANELWSEFWCESVDPEPGRTTIYTRPKASLNRDSIAEEAADVFFMLVQLSSLIGFDLAEAVAKKYAKNLKREWRAPDAQGVVEHIKPTAS